MILTWKKVFANERKLILILKKKEASVYAEVLRMLNLQADILLLLIKNLHRKMRKYMDEKCIDNFINKLRDCDFSFTQPVENIYSRNVGRK